MTRTATRMRWIGWLGCALLCLGVAGAAADIRIASKNIQNLGWGENKSVQALARILAPHDLLAIQEVMNVPAVRELQAELEAKTGEPWDILYSDRLGSSRYGEHYAFLWRERTVRYVDGAVVYIDDADAFFRPPYSARFASRQTGRDFVLATVHVRYGDRVADRVAEAEALARYWDWLGTVYPETRTRRILAGDFNLAPHHSGWAPLRERARNLMDGVSEGTTLSPRDGHWANLYDHIWVDRDSTLDITGHGVIRFPAILAATSGMAWTHEQARRHVSDHAPVYVRLGQPASRPYREGPLRVPNWQDPDAPALVPAVACIDLNRADRETLTELRHIGPARAKAIEQGRPWQQWADLTAIRGIGPNQVRALQDQGRGCPLP